MELSSRNIRTFRQILTRWARTGLREYPWRGERDAFRVLLAELMLRRTRADQVVRVYKRAISSYSTAQSMADAPAEEVKDLLKPLGLEWRADNIISAVREVAAEYGGKVPEDANELLNLTGVGDYVANAVACFAHGQASAILDTNVVRVIGRVFGLRLEGEARRRREVRDAVESCMDRKHPQQYNYAILDFAALVCRSRAPICGECPFAKRSLCEFEAAMRR